MHASRRGFNEDDFSDDPRSDTDSVRIAVDSTTVLDPAAHSDRTLEKGYLYSLLESTVLTLCMALILLVDSLLCVVTYLRFLQNSYSASLETAYVVLDWITAVLFFLEINLRLYCYGFTLYFHSALRSLEYLTSSTNTICIICAALTSARWLLLTRLTRLLRIATFIATWRERTFKRKAREELRNVAQVLEQDTEQADGLTKWKIPSHDIAVGEQAGHGGYGTVYSGLFRGTLVAVKQIRASEREESMATIEDEACTLVNLRHPNVVLFMGFACEPSHLWIVTEYCSRGSVRDVLDDSTVMLSEGRILKLALGAARGLAYLHGQSPPVLHLDLKTSNILISSGWEAKLADFGLSRNVTNIQRDCFSGTMQYTAPEVLEANQFSTAADIYSFGVCLWEMAAGDIPFTDKSPTSVLWGVVKSNLRPSLDVLNVKSNLAISSQRSEETFFPGSANCRQGDFINQALKCTHSGDDDVSHLQHQPSRDFLNSIQIEERRNIMETHVQRVKSSQPLCLPASRKEKESEQTCEVLREEKPSNDSVDRRLSQHRLGEDGTGHGQRSTSGHGTRVPQAIDMQPKSSQLDDLPGCATSKVRKYRSGDSSGHAMQTLEAHPPLARRRQDESRFKKRTRNFSKSSTKSQPRGETGVTPTMMPKLSQLVKETYRNIMQPKTASGPFADLNTEGGGGNETTAPSTVLPDDREPFIRRLATFSKAKPRQQPPEIFKVLSSLSGASSENHPSRKLSSDPMHRRAALPQQYLALIEKCWAQDPSARPSASEIAWMLMLLINGELE